MLFGEPTIDTSSQWIEQQQQQVMRLPAKRRSYSICCWNVVCFDTLTDTSSSSSSPLNAPTQPSHPVHSHSQYLSLPNHDSRASSSRLCCCSSVLMG